MTNNNKNADIGVPNGWTKNEKDRTSKCETCGGKVLFWCYQCVKCGLRICSECLDTGSDKEQRVKDVAQDHISKACWCKFAEQGNMNPEFGPCKRPPPTRTMEENEARELKGLKAVLPKATRSSRTAKLSRADDLASSLPNDDYDDPQTSRPTITATKPHRKGVKRKNYVDKNPESEMFVKSSSAKMKTRKASKRVQRELQDVEVEEEKVDANKNLLAHLRGEATVIVGAGVVGLFIAREIALAAQEAGIEHQVVVIELRKGCCELASGNSAGFLSTNGMPEDWNPIANSAKQWWLEVSSSAEICDQLQFDENTISQVVEGVPQGQGKAPSWLREDVEWSMLEDEHAVGLINPMSLAAWLYEQCRALNVEFYFEKSVSDVDFEAGSILSGIQIRNASGDPNSVAGIPCKNLVLAAGPFTTGIFGKLFKNTPLELENHVQGSDWFHIKTSAIGSRAGAAFRFPRAAEFENRMNNEIYMITNPSDKTITISGTTTHIKNTDMNAERAQEPSRGKTSELKLVAAKHLNEAEIDLKKDNIVHRGRSELSVANGMRPIIDRVPASSIGLACKDEKEDCQPCGVWLCYGFGKFGTMLAPGAAKILVSKMFGGRSDSMVADDDFRLPRHQKPQVEGKGKAKV